MFYTINEDVYLTFSGPEVYDIRQGRRSFYSWSFRGYWHKFRWYRCKGDEKRTHWYLNKTIASTTLSESSLEIFINSENSESKKFRNQKIRNSEKSEFR